MADLVTPGPPPDPPPGGRPAARLGLGLTLVLAILALGIAGGALLVTRALSAPDDEDRAAAPGTATVATAAPEEDGATTTTATADPTTTGTTPTTAARPAPDQVALPTTAEELSAALGEAETALRRPGAAEPAERDLTAAWARRQQILYRVMAANPDWADAVLAGVDPAILPAVQANWSAQTELLALVNTEELSPTLPAWRINPPAPADELLGYYHEAADASGVPWEILAAINLVESRMGRIEGVSTAGAVGPMQFLPSTWEGCCEGDATDPHDAIHGAATYLVQRGAADDLDRALRGYNNSDHYVRAVRAYASVLAADPDVYHAYHAWEVYFLSSVGLIRVPEGYEQLEPVDAATWVADHPGDLLLTGLG